MNEPRVSACIVLYRSGDAALKAVESLDRSDVPVDVWIVDNSPDEATAQRIRWSYPGVHILSMRENLGYGRGNNAVLDQLTSDYHLILNPDVSFEPDVLRRIVAYMDEHRGTAALTPKVMNEDGTEQHLPKLQPSVHFLLGGWLEGLGNPFARWRREYTMADRRPTSPVKAQFASGCFLFTRTALLKQLGGFDERFFLYQEDSDLSRRLLNNGSIIFHPDIRVTHAWARENKRTLRGTIRQIGSVLRYFRKWGITW